jgi:uncharacterized iron-regulated membrane protein
MLRKFFFQVHLWTGLGLGLYVVAICVTGSVTVFRTEYYNFFRPGSTVAARSSPRLSDDELKTAAEHVYPAYTVLKVQLRRRTPTASADIWLEGDGRELHRLFDPYTGADLGDAEPRATKIFEKIAEFHDNLLGDRTGRAVNGWGGAVLAVMSLTGMWVWWPGVKNWRRGLMVRWSSNWKRFNWDLHSALGFWTFAFVFMWAITGVYMVYPDPFLAVVDFFQPPTDDVPIRTGDTILEWFAKAHFGRFSGLTVKIIWGLIGLIPPILFVTGVIMWWNRKVRGWRRIEEAAYATYLKGFFR